jgi:hypothetical protein
MKKLFLSFVLLCGFLLTGCAKLTELSDQESDMLAEYMAGSLLKYDKNYEEALINPEYIKDSEKEEVQNINKNSETVDNQQNDNQVSEDSKNQEDTNIPQINIVSFQNILKDTKKDNFDISYSKYKIYDSYTAEDGYLVIETTRDKQLAVVKFDVKNLTKSRQNLNLIKSGFNYQLDTGVGTVYEPMMTLLVNDIQYINLDLDAGEKINAVIVFNINKGTDLSKANLTIEYQDKTTIIDLNK